VSSLTKEKKMIAQRLPHIDQLLQEAIQLRSCVFQVRHQLTHMQIADSLCLNAINLVPDNRLNVLNKSFLDCCGNG